MARAIFRRTGGGQGVGLPRSGKDWSPLVVGGDRRFPLGFGLPMESLRGVRDQRREPVIASHGRRVIARLSRNQTLSQDSSQVSKARVSPGRGRLAIALIAVTSTSCALASSTKGSR